jgi:cytochrome c553
MKCPAVKPGRLFKFSLLALMMPAMAAAQTEPSDCVELGALAFDNWTKTEAGGSGLPAGESSADYLRCKACHGWDRMGTEGGYVRRSRTASRPNAGAGDGDVTPRAIATGTVTADQIAHGGIGRSYADGSGSWVPLEQMHHSQNKSEHAAGYTLGNQHPDFSAGGPNGSDVVPTAEQLNCLAEFLNFEDADPSVYFSAIYPLQNPVLYSIVPTADAVAGEAFFETCEGCHGAPAEFVLGYLEEDGKFSELAHKARWGIPNAEMTRDALGDPSSADIANLLLYLQQLGGTGFAMNAGLDGNWYGGPDRNYEGFQLEVADFGSGLVLVATFYTYDTEGNQVWLLGVGPVDGNSADVTVYIYDGPSWGAGFNPADANEVEWGNGSFVAHSCGSVSMSLTPNAESLAAGFTDLEYDLIRVTTPAMTCPTPLAGN